jgi:sulfur carrier protein ThiS
VTVDGEPIDFTQEKYIMAAESFHFHGDEEAARWHGHSLNLTPAHALSTFPDMYVFRDTMTYEGTIYSQNGSDTSFTVTINGEEVDPHTYFLKDGDRIEVTLNETDDDT